MNEFVMEYLPSILSIITLLFLFIIFLNDFLPIIKVEIVNKDFIICNIVTIGIMSLVLMEITIK